MKNKKQIIDTCKLLEQALVPVDEQPYEVPENWVWVTFKGVTKFQQGIQIPKEQQLFEKLDGTVRFLRISDYTSETKPRYIYYPGSQYICKPQNVLMIRYGASAGKAVRGLSGVYANNLFNILPSVDILDSDYLFYFMQTPMIQKAVTAAAKSTAMPQVNHNNLYKVPICIPPIPEQKRIVTLIESLGDKLNQAEELITRARETYENRKAAILHKAFTGELTQKWRKENGVGMENWAEMTLSDLLHPMVTKRPSLQDEYFLYIDIDAIDNSIQQVRAPKKTLVSEAPSRASRGVEPGNILFSLVRPYLKNIAYISDNLADCIASTGFYVCRCKDKLNPKFLYFLLCNQKTIDYYTSFMKGDNSPSIRKENFLGLVINLPSLLEQQEIVRILDDLFDKEQQAKDLYDVIEKIDLMKKSILARAFRSELGTNDPTEESAMELLRKILAQ